MVYQRPFWQGQNIIFGYPKTSSAHIQTREIIHCNDFQAQKIAYSFLSLGFFFCGDFFAILIYCLQLHLQCFHLHLGTPHDQGLLDKERIFNEIVFVWQDHIISPQTKWWGAADVSSLWRFEWELWQYCGTASSFSATDQEAQYGIITVITVELNLELGEKCDFANKMCWKLFKAPKKSKTDLTQHLRILWHVWCTPQSKKCLRTKTIAYKI